MNETLEPGPHVPTTNPTPVADPPVEEEVVVIGRQWLAAIRGACCQAAISARLEQGTPLHVLVEHVEREHLPRYTQAQSCAIQRLVGPLAEQTADAMDDLRRGLLRLGPLAAEGPIALVAMQRRTGTNPFRAIEESLDFISLRLPRSRPPRTLRPDAQDRVWRALENRAMTAKEINKAVFDRTTSDDAVRQVIREMRTNGDRIERRAGRGYFRPDAPPPS